MTVKNKQQLLAEIKQLKAQHAALDVSYQRYTKTMRELRKRIDEIEEETQKIAVEIWRRENEAGIEQLLMF